MPEIRTYFRELQGVLFEKEYLSYEETAIRYIRELFTEISDTLPCGLKKVAPPYFAKYGKGMFYSAFKKSKHTLWYVFFNIYVENGEPIYLVHYISNNHMVAQLL